VLTFVRTIASPRGIRFTDLSVQAGTTRLVLKNTVCHQHQQVAADQQVAWGAGQSKEGGSRGEMQCRASRGEPRRARCQGEPREVCVRER
jgi:hypothetical protein